MRRAVLRVEARAVPLRVSNMGAHEQVRFFRRPQGEAYTDITASETPGATPVVALPGVTIDLAGVLG